MIRTVFAFVALLFLIPQQLETISWSKARKLTWQDFKAEPVTGTTAVALTASGITFGYSVQKLNGSIVEFDARISSHFYPEKSWVVKEHANDHILRHEQLHFDITELHVRKLREAVSKLRPSNRVPRQLDELHALVNKQLKDTQHAYDTQSNHSINIEAQLEWEKLIAVELEKLDEFASK
ncbi:DUF922 domain-containing protein [Winogradskyella sp. 3972H.M.0a.05]|uniref:DUF922 domain-containing protein n=1 Tax=Winogradskyella sp. 3972H.M.0a.05 TaxID=2950277 RepID=UPI003394D142